MSCSLSATTEATAALGAAMVDGSGNEVTPGDTDRSRAEGDGVPVLLCITGDRDLAIANGGADRILVDLPTLPVFGGNERVVTGGDRARGTSRIMALLLATGDTDRTLLGDTGSFSDGKREGFGLTSLEGLPVWNNCGAADDGNIVCTLPADSVNTTACCRSTNCSALACNVTLGSPPFNTQDGMPSEGRVCDDWIIMGGGILLRSTGAQDGMRADGCAPGGKT